MANWSQLPQELVVLIGKRLEARLDVLRFRSVCSSWRSSVPQLLYPLLTHLPSSTQGCHDESMSHITRNTFYLIRPSHSNQTEAPACWLVKITDGADPVEMRLLNPLSDSALKPLLGTFPKVLDLANFHVIELGHEYIGRYTWYHDHSLQPRYFHCRNKVVFLRSSTNSDNFILLALFKRYVHHLAFLRSGEKKWARIENVDYIEDILSYNGKFYAIDRKGRTIVIDQTLDVSFLGHVGSSCSRKFLVKSADNMLAVEMLFLASSNFDVDSDAERPVSNGRLMTDKVVCFRVFGMNEEEQEWDEMKSLRDQILFLGLHQAISAPASEFCLGRGNLIFYPEGLSNSRYYSNECRHIFVFDLETGTASPLENCPAYRNLFWPPPQWVTSSESVISSTQVISNSTYSVTSATPETEYKCPESSLAIFTTANLPQRVTSSAGKEVGSGHPSPSSK